MDQWSLDKPYVGTVLEEDAENRKVAVFIPGLMPTMQSQKNVKYSVPTNSGLTVQALTNNVSSSISKTNYIWARNWYKNDPMPKPGSKVMVYFIDENPLLCFWKKFDPNGDYDPIDDEKYRSLISLDVDGAESEISESDSLTITLPGYLKAIQASDGKSKKISIKDNFSFYSGTDLIKAIDNLQKSVEYMSSKTKGTFYSSLAASSSAAVADAALKAKIDSDVAAAKTKISNSENLLDAADIFSAYDSLVSAEESFYSYYIAYKALYAAVSDADKASLDAALGKSMQTSIETSYSSVLAFALKATSSASDSSTISSRAKELFPAEATYGYSYYHDVSKDSKQEIESASYDYKAATFSAFAKPDAIASDESKICHNGVLSSVALIGWKADTGFDPAAAKVICGNHKIVPILFGLYAEDYRNGLGLSINIANDPGYSGYTATMKTGTADAVAITSFPVILTSNPGSSIVFELKYQAYDLTLTISGS